MDDEGAIDASEENALAMQTKLGNIHFLLFIPSFTLYVLPNFFFFFLSLLLTPISLPPSNNFLRSDQEAEERQEAIDAEKAQAEQLRLTEVCIVSCPLQFADAILNEISDMQGLL